MDTLTPREREVLALLRLGLTNEEIAGRLNITLDGAKYHVSQILSKLGVATREEAAAIAPEPRRRWWAAWPLAAKAVGAALVVAAVAGLGVLTWGVLEEGGESNTSPVSSRQAGVRIDSLSPTSGTVGTQVVIRGTGFDSRENDVEFKSPGGAAYQNDIPSPDGQTLRVTLQETLGACAISQTGGCDDVGIMLPAGSIEIAVLNRNGTSNAVSFNRELAGVELAEAAIYGSESFSELTDLLDEIVSDSYQAVLGTYSKSYYIGIHEASDGSVFIELGLRGMDISHLRDKIPADIAGYEVRLQTSSAP
jgi:DNA-binding CsgD family transcriptional regulator